MAPAPTGDLQLGHVVNAIYVWGVARGTWRPAFGTWRPAFGTWRPALAGPVVETGRVLLRIEDHDRHRSRRAFESAILENLDWLGFIAPGEFVPLVRQSESDAVYESVSALDVPALVSETCRGWF